MAQNVFYDILEQKYAFLGYRNKRVKTSKIWIFPKWFIHGFGELMAFFGVFFFRQYRLGKVFFYDILDRKNVFLSFKN